MFVFSTSVTKLGDIRDRHYLVKSIGRNESVGMEWWRIGVLKRHGFSHDLFYRFFQIQNRTIFEVRLIAGTCNLTLWCAWTFYCNRLKFRNNNVIGVNRGFIFHGLSFQYNQIFSNCGLQQGITNAIKIIRRSKCFAEPPLHSF